MSTNRKRNRNTKPDDYSNQAWKKHLKEVDFQNPLIYQRIRYDQYFTHYFNWLQQIAYQLFEWDGFPDDVPKNYLDCSCQVTFLQFLLMIPIGLVTVRSYDQYFLKRFVRNSF